MGLQSRCRGQGPQGQIYIEQKSWKRSAFSASFFNWPNFALFIFAVFCSFWDFDFPRTSFWLMLGCTRVMKRLPRGKWSSAGWSRYTDVFMCARFFLFQWKVIRSGLISLSLLSRWTNKNYVWFLENFPWGKKIRFFFFWLITIDVWILFVARSNVVNIYFEIL